MAHCNTVFHTLAKILPRHEIDRLDKKYGQGDRRRKTNRYVQLIVMLMAQILGLKSLREIEQAQKSKQKRLYHLGVKLPVSRSAPSRMNDERSADFSKDVFHDVICKGIDNSAKTTSFLFSSPLRSLVSNIVLCTNNLRT